jgi:ATP-binding cassette subfamily B protein
MAVAENIGYGRLDATAGEIEEAARLARADGFIRRLPEGYRTVLGSQGATLSGGERQRIAIARAMIKQARILILDEPSSALDSQTESELMDAIRTLRRDRTTFVIAHRLSTVRDADRILVLDQGRIVESGGHHELKGAGGAYARLCAAQYGGGAAVA